jgi:hypothetical protein
MIETLSFLLGLGFSILVYFMAIKPGAYSPLRKLFYGLLSGIGITGMLWLSGILIAHFLRKFHIIS